MTRPLPLPQRISRWIFDHLLWDTGGIARQGFWGGLWATRKLIIALAGSALLDWMEWVEHHPPEMVIVVLVHFVLVLGVIALFVYVGQRVKGSRKEAPKV
jgi:hypothetical protein